MAPVSLKIVLNNGAVTRKVKFDTTTKVDEAHDIVKEKMHLPNDGKEYGLFLRSADDDLSGVWLEGHRILDYYMLRDGDSLDYLCRMRNLRVRMLDGTVKTLQVDEGKPVGALMFTICSKIGISNHDEYGLCLDDEEEAEEKEKEKQQPASGTLTLTRKAPPKEKDQALDQLIKKHNTDDDVQWLDQHRTLRELGVEAARTLLLKRRLYYSDRNVDPRDPVQLNLLYVQIRDLLLDGRHPVTEDQAADCKIRWINIRDVHRRMLKKKINNSHKYIRPYKYETELVFMRAFYKDVVISTPEECEEDDSAYAQTWVEQNETNSDDSAEKPIRKRPKTRKTTKRRKEIQLEEDQLASTSVCNETVVSQPELDSTDPVDAFLISIAATLKTFSPYHLNVAKSKIFAVVQEHDLEQIVQKGHNEGSTDVKVSTSEAIQYLP